ncbi:MAG: hypothetical protein SOX40_04420 [Bacteroidaceae bacterium]|nr:hypothetical protein [Bacteroidaceae bacterium]
MLKAIGCQTFFHGGSFLIIDWEDRGSWQIPPPPYVGGMRSQ